MNNEKLTEMINLYFDNELSKQEEVILFTALADNDEMRELFKKYNMLNSTLEESKVEYPSSLDEKIYSQVLAKEATKVKTPIIKINKFVFYAMSMILILASLLIYTEFRESQNQMEYTRKQLINQSKMVNELLNSIPTVTVRSRMDNEIIIQSKIWG